MFTKPTCIVVFILTFISVRLFAQSDTITVLHVNDTHSCLAPLAPRNTDLSGTVGGIARLATVLQQIRSASPDVIFLHAGDYSIGDPVYNSTYGVPELTLLRQLGLDAMALGNHEFDLTPATLEGALGAVFSSVGPFPILSGNLIYPPDTSIALSDFVSQYVIKQVGNIKVGIFGLTTPETNIESQPSPLFLDTNFVETAALMVDSLTEHGCSVIILLSHLGLNYDKLVASNVPGIDVIVGGHDHYVLSAPIPVLNPAGDTTLVVQAGAFYEYVGDMRLVLKAGKVSLLDYKLIHLDNTIQEDPTIRAMVDEICAVADSSFGEDFYTRRIGYATEDFYEIAGSVPGSSLRDTPVGNLVTDAFRDSMKTDVAITAGGCTAQPLRKGPIVGADVFRMLGYGFNTDNMLGYRLATFKITGLDIMKALEFTLGTVDMNDEFQMQVSGMTYSYAPDQPAGSRLKSVIINGSQVDPQKEYSVASNEYVLMMLNDFIGPQVGGITINDPKIFSGVSEYQVVSAYIESKDTISPSQGSRVTPIVSMRAKPIPTDCELFQNYPNPFNPSTTISYQLSESSLVTLKIYDVLGREIATLKNGKENAGEHVVKLDGSRLASGVYFYRIATAGEKGSYVAVKKMILLK